MAFNVWNNEKFHKFHGVMIKTFGIDDKMIKFMAFDARNNDKFDKFHGIMINFINVLSILSE